MANDLTIGQVGAGGISDGATRAARGGRYGAMAVMQAHGKYFDAVDRGAVFMASGQAEVTFGTALTATGVTYHLYNPAGSGKNLVVLQTTLTIRSAGTAGHIVYAVNATAGQAAPATTTSLTVFNGMLIGGESNVGRAFSVATLPAVPVAVRTLAGSVGTAANVYSLVDTVDGLIVLPENTILSIQGITIVASGIISMVWEEVSP